MKNNVAHMYAYQLVVHTHPVLIGSNKPIYFEDVSMKHSTEYTG